MKDINWVYHGQQEQTWGRKIEIFFQNCAVYNGLGHVAEHFKLWAPYILAAQVKQTISYLIHNVSVALYWSGDEFIPHGTMRYIWSFYILALTCYLWCRWSSAVQITYMAWPHWVISNWCVVSWWKLNFLLLRYFETTSHGKSCQRFFLVVWKLSLVYLCSWILENAVGEFSWLQVYWCDHLHGSMVTCHRSWKMMIWNPLASSVPLVP